MNKEEIRAEAERRFPSIPTQLQYSDDNLTIRDWRDKFTEGADFALSSWDQTAIDFAEWLSHNCDDYSAANHDGRSQNYLIKGQWLFYSDGWAYIKTTAELFLLFKQETRRMPGC